MYQAPSETPEYKEQVKERNRQRAKKYHHEHKEEIKKKRAAYFAEYRLKNRDKINSKSHHYNTTEERKARRIKFYIDNKELDKHRTRRAYLKRMFGITLEQYEEMVISQGDCCAICGKHRTTNKQRLAVDHCHLTGVVMGLLCSHCNKSLGTFKDSINILNKAIAYLQKESPLVKADSHGLDFII